jgi:ribosome maturation protein Sdo1
LPSAAVTVRVAPEDTQKLMGQVEKQGSIVQHTTESEDKTSAVVDTDAKIKNLTGFRDHLRTMFTKPSATVKDSVEIQQ